MTSTTQAGGASPVDFADIRGLWRLPSEEGGSRQAEQSAGTKPGDFVRAAYPFQGRITADGSSGYPAEPAGTTCTFPGPARGRTGPRSCANCSA